MTTQSIIKRSCIRTVVIMIRLFQEVLKLKKCEFLNLYLHFTLLQSSGCCQWSMEAEHGITNGNKTYRSSASGKLTVRLNESQYTVWGFITDYPCTLQVFNIEYTNDGFSDTITLCVDGLELGSLHTREESNHGHLWNVPISSGEVGNQTILPIGDHTFKVVATAVDQPHLVEVDRATLGLLCLSDKSDSDGICPRTQEADTTLITTETWEKDTVIVLVFGLFGAVVGVITCTTGIVTHCKRNEKPRNSNQEALLANGEGQQPAPSRVEQEHVVATHSV